MAQIKIMTLENLQSYDPKIKNYITEKVSESDLKSLKTVAIDGNTLKFYRVSEPVGETAPAYTITLPETDISGLIAKIDNAVAGNVVIAKADGSVEDGGVKLTDLAKTSEVEAVETKIGVIPEGYTSTTIADYAKELADAVAANGYDDTALKARVDANETAITTLNGTGEGSVSKKVADAVAAIVADAPEAYDTLKEISDWISSHASDASAMNTQINTNKTDIANLTTLVGSLPEGAASTTIVTYIAEAIGASKTDLTSSIATAKSEAISTAATDAQTKADTALADAKAYADGKDTAIAAAKKAGTDAQADVDALETKVGTVATGKTVVQMIADAQAAATYDDTTVKASIQTNASDIDTLESKVAALEDVSYVAITNAEIDALFV